MKTLEQIAIKSGLRLENVKSQVYGLFRVSATELRASIRASTPLSESQNHRILSFCINNVDALIRVVKIWIFQIWLIQFLPIII